MPINIMDSTMATPMTSHFIIFLFILLSLYMTYLMGIETRDYITSIFTIHINLYCLFTFNRTFLSVTIFSVFMKMQGWEGMLSFKNVVREQQAFYDTF